MTKNISINGFAKMSRDNSDRMLVESATDPTPYNINQRSGGSKLRGIFVNISFLFSCDIQLDSVTAEQDYVDIKWSVKRTQSSQF